MASSPRSPVPATRSTTRSPSPSASRRWRTGAIASVKELVADAPQRSLVDQLEAERDHFLANLFDADGAEGLQAFVDKRAPRFR